MEAPEEGKVSGTMFKVAGTIYRGGKPVSDFTAEKGVSQKDSDELSLEGTVKIVSRDPKGTMSCQQVVWRPKQNRVEAKGNVRLEMPPWETGVFPELWCNPELTEVATPNLYGK